MDTVPITGCASGIGRATPDRFQKQGWTVHATDVDADGLDERGCETRRMGVTEPSGVESVVDAIAAEASGIDCLVNSAGYGQMGTVEDVPIDRMCERGDGTIVTVASVMGWVASPSAGSI